MAAQDHGVAIGDELAFFAVGSVMGFVPRQVNSSMLP
jgi:hypothetical protein